MNKAIVLGAGLSGIAATKLLIKNEIEVLLFDNNPKINIDKIKKNVYGKAKLTISLEDISEKEIGEIKLCVISPGFPKNNSVYEKIVRNKIPVISELELGYLYAKGEICAITGTNGKATTVEMIKNMLEHVEGKNNNVINSTDMPFCEKLLKENDDKQYVVKCNSFQLEDIVKFKPHVASILNISPDHLNRYNNYINYINANLNIAINMDKDDILILNYEDPILRELAIQKNLFVAKVVFFSSKRILIEGFYIDDDAIFYKDKVKTIKLVRLSELKISGLHNYEDAMAAIASAFYMGKSFIDIIDTLKEFKGLPHRLEFVREKNGVKYYNDSKSTNPDASIKAIDALKGKMILIVGGRDKGLDYGDLLVKVREKVRYLILIGEAKKKIANAARLLNYTSIIYADTLEEAVDIANSYSNVGDNVLLSPACSSFDMFKGYEDRGEKYVKKVMSMK